MCVGAYTCTCMSKCAFEGQKTTFKRQFSTSATWIPGIDLREAGLAGKHI